MPAQISRKHFRLSGNGDVVGTSKGRKSHGWSTDRRMGYVLRSDAEERALWHAYSRDGTCLGFRSNQGAAGRLVCHEFRAANPSTELPPAKLSSAPPRSRRRRREGRRSAGLTGGLGANMDRPGLYMARHTSTKPLCCGRGPRSAWVRCNDLKVGKSDSPNNRLAAYERQFGVGLVEFVMLVNRPASTLARDEQRLLAALDEHRIINPRTRRKLEWTSASPELVRVICRQLFGN